MAVAAPKIEGPFLGFGNRETFEQLGVAGLVNQGQEVGFRLDREIDRSLAA